MKLTIAVFGWGSLIWDPRELKIGDSSWQRDGPLLPIEYLHASGTRQPPKRLTLVVVDQVAHPWVNDVRTLWAMSSFDELERARENLANRERTDTPKIGYVNLKETDALKRSSLTAVQDQATKTELLSRIERWMRERHIDAAIWTDLAVSPDLEGQPVTPQGAIGYLRGLGGDDRRAAEAYIRHTPTQVWTAIRARAELELGWSVEYQPTPIRSADDLRFKDWSEARAAIARFDTILVDLRKVGFSIVTGLLAASSFLGFLGVPAGSSASASTPASFPIEARAGVWVTIMALVVLLFLVDMYFEVLLSGAVERALDVEVQTDPPVRVTKYLSSNVQSVWGAKLVFGMYLGVLVLVIILAGVMLVFASADERARVWLWMGLTALFALLVVAGYGVVGRRGTHLDSLKPRRWPEGKEKVAAPEVSVSSWQR